MEDEPGLKVEDLGGRLTVVKALSWKMNQV